jgi:hypothetical protein
MGLSESILNHTINCCQNICEDCEFDSECGCCKTHYANSPRRHNSKDSNHTSDNENNDNNK